MAAIYILDSNVFIQSHRSLYPFDVFPSFWTMLKNISTQGNVFSIDKVKKELCDDKTDILSVWCTAELNSSFFIDTSISIDKYAEIARFINGHTRYNQPAKDKYLGTEYVDSWIVAHCLHHNHTVVTNEISSPGSVKNIKIPDVCNDFGVRCITPIEMLREIGAII